MTDFVYMPQQIQTGAACKLIAVFADIGQDFHSGQILFAYEYDGARLEERAVASGRTRAVFFKAGDKVNCGVPVIAYDKI